MAWIERGFLRWEFSDKRGDGRVTIPSLVSVVRLPLALVGGDSAHGYL